MKKFSFFALLAVAAFAVGCSEDVDNGGSSMERKLIDVSFGVDIASEDSRSEVDLVDGKVQGNWELDTDKIGVFSAVDQNKEFTYGDNKLFNGQLTEAAEYTLQAYYPYGADYAEGTTVTIPFGVERPQDGGKFNSAYDILLSEPKTTSELDGHTFDFVRPLSVLNFDTSAAGAFRYARLTDLDGGLLSTGGLTFEMGANPTLAVAVTTDEYDTPIDTDASIIWVDLGSEAAHADVFFNVLPGNYNLKLDLLTEDGKISSTSIDRTNAEKPFEAGKFYYKKVSGEFVATAAPSVVWPDGNGGFMDMDAAHEITVDESYALTYPATLEITADAGIQMMYVHINSEFITSDLGKELFSLIPNNEMASIGLPGGAAYHYATEATFDVTGFLPLIAMMAPDTYGDHIFTLYIVDGLGRELEQPLHFTLTEPAKPIEATASVGSVDLWANTASVSVVANQEVGDVKVFVKDSDETTYNEIEVTSADKINWTAAVAPAWQSTTNGEGNTVYYLDGKTGIFAGNKYDYYVEVYDSESNLAYTSDVATYTAGAGDAFYQGDFASSYWGSNKQQFITTSSSGSLAKTYIYSYWGSGYNSYTPNLCTVTTFDGKECATLQATYNSTLVSIPAPGNLFTGDFRMQVSFTKGNGGYVDFGKKVTYGARPRAVKVWAKAIVNEIGTVQFGTEYKADSGKDAPAVGTSDRARIFVCMTNWSGQHSVFAGSKRPTGAWNPEGGKKGNMKAGTEAISVGDIVSYAMVDIDNNHSAHSSDKLVEIEMPLYYYDTTAANNKAALNDANYNIVVSAATSYLGDYMISSSTNSGNHNTLYIDKFEWVY